MVNRTIPLSGDSGMVYAYEGATGNLRWIHAADTTQVSGLALGTDGTVYAATQRGVQALNGQSGTPEWSFTPGYSVISVSGDGTVYVAAGNLYALDGQAGQTKWTSNTDQAPNSGFHTEST